MTIKTPSPRKGAASEAVRSMLRTRSPLRYGDDPYVWACGFITKTA